MLSIMAACGNALPVQPLQSVVATPTPVLPTPAPGLSTQTPIVLATATLGAAGPTAPSAATTAAPAVATPRPVIQATSRPAPTLTLPPSPTIDLTQVFAPPGTPNTKATSFAVILTITALAATPTYPPTSTMRPRRQPIIIGAGGNAQDRLPATTEPRKQGIVIQSISPQVTPGGQAALAIQTVRNTPCSLQISRPLGGERYEFEPIDGSARQSASRDGGIAWIWTVDTDEPAGPMRLLIDCGAAGVQRTQISVVR
jgi:hypothetical protein